MTARRRAWVAPYADDAPTSRALNVYVRAEQAPDRDNRIELTSERDRLGVPRVQLKWRWNNRDKESASAALRHYLIQLGANRLGRARLLGETLDAPECELEGGRHHLGTTRMSEPLPCRELGLSHLGLCRPDVDHRCIGCSTRGVHSANVGTMSALERRSLIRLFGLALVARVFGSSKIAWADLPSSEWHLEIGKRYLLEHPSEADVALLCRIVGRGGARAASLEEFLADHPAVVSDFDEGNAVFIDRWCLSRFEARACALAFLSR
jgi:hypothetical protein